MHSKRRDRVKTVNQSMMEFASRLATEIDAKAILFYGEAAPEITLADKGESHHETIVITRGENDVPREMKSIRSVINIPDVDLTRLSQLKIAIIKGIAARLFAKGDKLVCLTGVPKFGYIDSLFIIDVGKEFELLTSENISDIFEGIRPEVFETVLNIALELGAQGREGRQVGTIFVIGDHDRVLQLSRQMIINPFMGYKEEERNILDRNLRDTIKEFSALDGAFVIRHDGVLVTAGSHLSAALESKDFPQGLGSRHIAAAGITSVTDAIAIVVSESTGTVRIFKKGRIFVDIEKA
jgi:diadenylate cyclase